MDEGSCWPGCGRTPRRPGPGAAGSGQDAQAGEPGRAARLVRLNGAADGGKRGAGGPPYDLSDPVVQVEREVLKLAVQRPALCGPEFDALGADAFTAPGARRGVRG